MHLGEFLCIQVSVKNLQCGLLKIELCVSGAVLAFSLHELCGSFPTSSVRINFVLYVLLIHCSLISKVWLLMMSMRTCIQEQVWRFLRHGGAGF